MRDANSASAGEDWAYRLAEIEQRLARLESMVEKTSPSPASSGSPSTTVPSDIKDEVVLPDEQLPTGEDLELMVGQSWFARVGIGILAIGGALALSLPYAGIPPLVPSLVGFALVIALFLAARWLRDAFALLANYLRGAALALLYFATIRLFHFGTEPVLTTESTVGRTLLLVVVGISVSVALYRRSPYLAGLSVVGTTAVAIVVGTTGFLFGVLGCLAVLTVYVSAKRDWPGLVFFCIHTTYLAYLIWMLNNPVMGNAVQIVDHPPNSVYFVLCCMLVFAAGSMLRQQHDREDSMTIINALFNCGVGYPLFLTHTFAGMPETMVAANLAASAVLLGLAMVLWVREKSLACTFFYAMTGYMALSVAILRAFDPPNVFVWLSLQSIVVVATALWFRSRFIVVANFFIFLITILGYLGIAERETGISLCFGMVALITARILKWQQERLALKTEMMRNAYLATAWSIFPYALYHLVPKAYVSLAWVGVALGYYLMNFIVRSPKYRWMGHLTLLLTVVYVLAVGIIQLKPALRVLSFMVLGSVLVIISLVFTRVQARKKAADEADEQS